VVAGARFILGTPIVRAALAATATINFFNFVFWAILVLYATRELRIAPGTLGLVIGAGAVGGLIGSLVTGRLGRRLGIGPAFVLGCVLFPVPLVLVPLADGPRPLVLAMLLLAEFGSGLGGALGSAIGLRPTLWIATVGAVAGFLWLLPSPVPRLRDLPEKVPETAA